MNLLITGAWGDAEKYIPLIEHSGNSVVFMQQEKYELPCDPSMIQGVVCNGLFLHHDIRQFTSLKFIQLTSAGTDRVPVDYIKDNNINLYNARGVYSIPMAEHAVAAALDFFRNRCFFYENQKNRKWEKARSLRELYGKTVCVIGCGSVGQECAKRFTAFGCRVTGIDILPFASEFFDSILGIDSLYNAIGAADIIVLTLPLNEKTKGLVDGKFLSCLKKGCMLINIARGGLVNTAELIKALTEKRIFAALDVFDTEPLPAESPLWQMDNVIITPHNSFVGDQNAARLNKLIMENLEYEHTRYQTTC